MSGKKAGSAQARVSPKDKEMRIHTIFKMLSEGYATATIHDHMEEKWKLGQRQRTDYLRWAYASMKKMMSIEKETLIAKTLHQREFVIENLSKSGNFAMMSQAIADRDKMLGLYEKEEIDANVTIKVKQS